MTSILTNSSEILYTGAFQKSMLMRLLPEHKIEPEPKEKKTWFGPLPPPFFFSSNCNEPGPIILKHLLNSNQDQTLFLVTNEKWKFSWLCLPRTAQGPLTCLRSSRAAPCHSLLICLSPTGFSNMPSTRCWCWAILHNATSPGDHFSPWNFWVGFSQMSYGYVAPGREEQETLLIQVS